MAQDPGPAVPRPRTTSLAAGGPRRHGDAARREPTEVGGAGAHQERVAAEDEARMALRLGLLVTPLVATLVLLALGNAAGVLEATAIAGETRALPVSLLSIVLVLVAVQLVAATLALEHLACGPGSDGENADPVLLVWMARFLVLVAVSAAVVTPFTAVRRWDTVGWTALVVELLTLAGLLLATWLCSQRAAGSASTPPEREQEAAADERPWTDGPGRIQAIGASGGGIRAAAFVLGGHQAVQDARADAADAAGAAGAGVRAGDTDEPVEEREPAVFAVSGGSYVAAALALRRTYHLDGSRREQPASWRTAYAAGSPEVERLRRHTRYLFEPPRRTRDGVVSLVMGAAVHLLIVGAALRFLTWVSTQLALTLGIVELDRRATGDGWQARALGMSPDWDAWQLVAVLGVPVICLLLVVQQTVSGWRGTSAFNSEEVSQQTTESARSSATSRLDNAARRRPTLLALAVGWLLLFLGLPAATIGVVDMTTENRPSATGSAALSALGFATPAMCTESFVERVTAAVERANTEGRISPDVPHSVETGACGIETTVVRTVDSRGDADPDNDVVVPVDPDAARLLTVDNLLAWQVAGLGTLFLGVIALLRRGPTPEANASARWWSRLKRVLLTWLPLLIVGLVALYAVLIWSFGMIVNMDTSYRGFTALLTVAGLTLAFLVDANATSMHGFYRSRLADAFAVTRRRRRSRPRPAERARLPVLRHGARAGAPGPTAAHRRAP